MQIASFVLLLGLMVILNHRLEKVHPETKHAPETISSIDSNTGIVSLASQVPENPEGALPIKLISNPNSPFLLFISKGYELKNNFSYTQNRKRFLNYCFRLQTFFIEIMVTARNKDIQ